MTTDNPTGEVKVKRGPGRPKRVRGRFVKKPEPAPVVQPESLVVPGQLSVREVRESAEGWFGDHVKDLRKSSDILLATEADGTEEATEKLKQLKLREEVREKQIASGLSLFGRGAAAKERPNVTVDVTLIQKDGTITAQPVVDVDEVVPEKKKSIYFDKPVPVKVYDPFA